jgi:hypothetical protein
MAAEAGMFMMEHSGIVSHIEEGEIYCKRVRKLTVLCNVDDG